MATHRVTPPRRRRATAGFTLLEVLIALVVTGIGLTGIAALTVSNAHGVRYARHATEATILAEDQLERMNTWPAAQLVSGADQVDAQGLAVANGGYARGWTVQQEGNLAHIALAVSWSEGGDSQALTFWSVRSR